MSITLLTFTLLGIFLILHFYLIPKAENNFETDLNYSRVRKNTYLSILSVFKGVVFMFFLATLIVLGIMMIFSLKGGATTDEIHSSISQIQSWKSGIGDWSRSFGLMSIGILLGALLIHAYRRSKIKASKAFEKIHKKEYQRLSTAFENGNLNKLEMTPDLEENYKSFHEIQFILNNPDKVEFPKDVPPELILKELSGKAKNLFKIIKEKEIKRRINLTIKKEEAELPKPVTFWDKLQTFFISKGLMNNLNRMSRAFYGIGLLLIIPSMISIYSPNIKSSAITNIANLENLIVDLSLKEADKNLTQAINKLPAEEENYDLTAEDEAVIEEVAQIYESTLAEGFLQGTSINVATRVAFRTNVVKTELLRRYAKKVPKSVKSVKSGSNIDNLSSKEKAILTSSEDLASKKTSNKIKGHSLREDLKKAAKKNPSVVKRLKNELKSFQTPVKYKDISRALVKQTFSSVVGEAVDPNLSKMANSGLDDFKKRELSTLHQAQSKKFASKIINGEPLSDAVNSVRTSAEVARMESNFRSVVNNMPMDGVNNKVRTRPPAVRSIPEPHVNIPNASGRLETLSKNSRSRGSAQYGDAIANMDDYFPAQHRSDAQTPRHKFQQKVNPSYASKTRSKSGFNRSRSFGKLRGFSRVGGVLIGHENPLSSYDAKYEDLSWNIKNEKIQFMLTDEKGEVYTSKYYKIPIAYHALNYASDGRPLAVTMVSAKPMMELKILLHPTLIDSPMGKRIIDLDRFVDQYTGDDYKRKKARELVYGQYYLYQLAWCVRLKAAVSQLSSSEFNPSDWMVVQSYVRQANEMLNSDQILERAQLGLDSEALSDSERSPLYAKNEFFDRAIVNKMIASTKKHSSINRFLKDLSSSFKAEFSSSYKVDINNVLTFFPEFDLWSGVREKKYTIAPENLLMIEGKKSEIPLHFMEQVAFTSAPAFGQYKDDENYADEGPWEFPIINEYLNNKTIRAAQSDSKSSKILKDATEFTYLQRLFRMGLNGHLGEEFPVEKLIDLVEELEAKDPIRYYRTLRWNANISVESIKSRLMLSGVSSSEIEEILKIREELGIPKDRKQQLRDSNNSLPSLY